MQRYHVQQLLPNLHVIEERILGASFPIRLFLVTGDRRAALIDTGLGTGDLRAVVETVTRLPVIVLHTHGHGDHIGADALFSEHFLHPQEKKGAGGGYAFGRTAASRLAFLSDLLPDEPDTLADLAGSMVEGRAIRYGRLRDGDRVDLGGCVLEVVHIPGHTPGSVAFVDRGNGQAFTGDGIADIHWFDGASETTVSAFRRTLGHFLARAEGVETCHAAHMGAPFDLGLVGRLHRAATEILEGADDPLEQADYGFLRHGILYAHRTGDATLYYDREHVHDRACRGRPFCTKA